MAWTPRELPYQRDKAVTVLNSAAHMWATAAGVNEQQRANTINALEKYIHGLEHAELTWISKDVCTMLTDITKSLPPFSPRACMPSNHGLIAYETPPIEGTWANGVDGKWRTVTIDSILWTTNPDNTITIRALSTFQGHRDYLSPLRTGIPFDEVVAITIDANTTQDSHVEIHRKDGYEGPTRTAKDLSALIGATWLLLTQPTVTNDATPAIAHVKRSINGQPRTRQEVRVSIKQLTAQPTTNNRGDGQSGRTFQHRWWVRGHWKQQAYGPGRELRKPIFIAPHTAGAAGGDIDERPQVQIIKD